MLRLNGLFHHMATLVSENKVTLDILESPRRHISGRENIPEILQDPYGLFNHTIAEMFSDFVQEEMKFIGRADLLKENVIFDWDDHEYILSRVPIFLEQLDEIEYLNKIQEVADHLYRAFNDSDALDYLGLVRKDLSTCDTIRKHIDPDHFPVPEPKSLV